MKTKHINPREKEICEPFNVKWRRSQHAVALRIIERKVRKED